MPPLRKSLESLEFPRLHLQGASPQRFLRGPWFLATLASLAKCAVFLVLKAPWQVVGAWQGVWQNTGAVSGGPRSWGRGWGAVEGTEAGGSLVLLGLQLPPSSSRAQKGPPLTGYASLGTCTLQLLRQEGDRGVSRPHWPSCHWDLGAGG